jgi:phytoene synthase
MSTAPAALLVTPATTISDSYRYCRQIARSRAKNFYYSFLVLPKEQRDAMCAIYAFMRKCDDLSDDPASTEKSKIAEAIAQWRVDTDRALHGDVTSDPIWPAFHDTVKRFDIPHRFFHEMIDGITSDLEPREIKTFDELYHYCYSVASVVGLTIIHIWGYKSPKALLLAEKCGVAFQLTNILRDVREDAQIGRIYLPVEDLRRFGVTVQQIQHGIEDDHFRELMKYEASRARTYYEESAPLINLISERSRACLWALRKIYMGLLSRIESAKFAVLSNRINVPTRTKLRILAFAMLRGKRAR